MITRKRARLLALGSALILTLACSLLQAPPTATPTPTETPAPTSTATATRTPVPTITARATADSSAAGGRPATRTLADGSIELTDSLIGYTLTLPSGWIVLNPGAEETEAILEAAGEANPELRWMLEGFGQDLAQGIRFTALDSDLVAGDTDSLASITLVALEIVEIPLDLLLETTANSLESMVPGAEILSRTLIPDLNGQPAGRIDWQLELTTLDAAQVTLQSTLVILHSGEHLIEMALQAEQGVYPNYRPAFEQVIQSLTLQ